MSLKALPVVVVAVEYMEVVEGLVENADIFVVGQEIAGRGIVPEAHMSWKCSSVLMDIG